MPLRPINLLLIYSISLIHLSIILIPIGFFALLVLKIISNFTIADIVPYAVNFWGMCIFFISLFCTSYLFLDFVFGFTIRGLSKGAKNVYSLKRYKDIAEVFDIVKTKFNNNKTDLYISTSNEINAYAIGGLRKSRIIVTDGLIDHIIETSENQEEVKSAIAGIIGHEMSHIINMDFLPGVFLYSIEIAIRYINKIITTGMFILTAGIGFIPIFGWILKYFITIVRKILDFISYSLFYKKIIIPVSFMISRFLSRSVEYRSDMDSARALGGEMIYSGLSKIQSSRESVWRSIFSTHPRTKSRMSKVKDVKAENKKIKPSVITDFSNMWSLMMLIFCTFFLAYTYRIDKLPHYATKVYILTEETVQAGKKKFEEYKVIANKVYSLYNTISNIFG